MNKEKITFRESSGNVFADFGLEDADDLMAKAELALAIRKRIEQKGLTQTQAAELIGTTQARVSELYNAKVMKMTFDRLLGFLNALECDTYITVAEHDAGDPEEQGKIVVNGIVVNGIVVNGIVVNGIVVNGIVVNGIVVNGIVVNGIVVRGQEGSLDYAAHDGSAMPLQVKEGRAHWTEKPGPDSPKETHDFDPKRAVEIMKMFHDRSREFLDNSPAMTASGDDTQRLSAGDCAYIAAILKKAVDESGRAVKGRKRSNIFDA